MGTCIQASRCIRQSLRASHLERIFAATCRPLRSFPSRKRAWALPSFKQCSHSRAYSSVVDKENTIPHGSATAFIGIGSNEGDRVAMIEQACRELDRRKIHVARTSSLWETPAMYVLDQPSFLNGVCEVSTRLPPLELLDQLQDIERLMGRRKIVDKGQRNIDLDILLYDDLRMEHPRLTIPHRLMLEREFVLRPLCQLIPHTIFPSSTKDMGIPFRLHLANLPPPVSPISTVTPLTPSGLQLTAGKATRQTQIMAIINMTPDSFSDGGDHLDQDLDAFAARTIASMDAGQVSIVDVGGQSTRPGAEDVGVEEELRRVLPAIRALRHAAQRRPLCISVDTYRATVAAQAVDAGADMVNDISGATMDPDMLPTVAEKGVPICLMHTRGTPATMSRMTDYAAGVIPTLAGELLERVRAAEVAGIRRWRIIIDPGIGFAKNEAQNLEVLRDLHLLSRWPGLEGLPVLVGASRKGFIGRITGVAEPRDRVWGTAAAVTAAVAGGADVVRVHDVAAMSQVVKMADALWRGS